MSRIGYRDYPARISVPGFRSYTRIGYLEEDVEQMTERLKKTLSCTLSVEDTEIVMETISNAIRSGWVGGLKSAKATAEGYNADATARDIQYEIHQTLPWNTHEWRRQHCEKCGVAYKAEIIDSECPVPEH